ncbi:tRNA (guanine(9)-N(1))-methyltransferase [Theileria orientalis]|uniref:tRNA (guanine(9)-N(1))-methyltransferase n=1 Tax=Theileria orientalis TaxID=68886 RepID=A0A976MF68_THEOR|nr:tRNA (guanine(9)-N(1))-methyltransferase [Theileria orientalis]
MEETPDQIQPKTRLPRSQKKKLKRLQKLERRRQRRPEIRRKRKEVLRNEREELLSSMTAEEKEEYILNLRKTNYEKSVEISKFLDECQETGSPICINCSFEDSMNPKEIRSLAKQISLCYNIMKKHLVPIKLILTSFSKESSLYKDCELFGIHKWKVHFEEKGFWEVFDRENTVVLSPDANEYLEDVEEDRVYVIGGLVDTNVKKVSIGDFTVNAAVSRIQPGKISWNHL